MAKSCGPTFNSDVSGAKDIPKVGTASGLRPVTEGSLHWLKLKMFHAKKWQKPVQSMYIYVFYKLYIHIYIYIYAIICIYIVINVYTSYTIYVL